MERTYTVYMHINKVNGKKYIGITCDKVENRWRNGKGYHNQVFGKAIEKYGWENFNHEIVATNLTQQQAEQLERSLIQEFNTQNPIYGYNITPGGGATLPSLYFTVYQYDNQGNFIAKYPSYKQAEKASNIRADNIGAVCLHKRYTAGGYVWSNEPLSVVEVLNQFSLGAKQKVLGSQKGINNAVEKISMKVQQIDTKTGQVIAEYPSQREAARTIGIDQKGISLVVRGKRKTAGGFYWKQIEESSTLN